MSNTCLADAGGFSRGSVEPQAAGPLPHTLPDVAASATLAWPGLQRCCSLAFGRRAELSTQTGSGDRGAVPADSAGGLPPSCTGQGHCQGPQEARFHLALISGPVPVPGAAAGSAHQEPPVSSIPDPDRPLPGWRFRSESNSRLEKGRQLSRGQGDGKGTKVWPSLPFQGEPACGGTQRKAVSRNGEAEFREHPLNQPYPMLVQVTDFLFYKVISLLWA